MSEEEPTAAINAPIVVEEKSQSKDLFKTPDRSLKWTIQGLFALASLVTGLCNVTIKQLLLPTHVSLLDPVNTFTTFSVIASAGALAGVITSPVAGAISDRTTWRWGRRRPFLLVGLVLAMIGLTLMAQATTIWQLLIGGVLVQIAVDMIMAVVVVLIPDQVPPRQRAIASAFIGMSPIVGGLVGMILVSRLINAAENPQPGYFVLLAASCVCILPFFLVLKDPPLEKGVLPPIQIKTLFRGFWVNPRKYPDFGYTWLSRAFVFLGYTILISYLLYYLRDVLQHPAYDQAVVFFQITATGTLIVAAILGGIAADRSRRIKPFVFGGALAMTIALIMIAFIPVWQVMLVAAVILGAGFGVYLAVDIALAVHVLPEVENRGKDLGLINTAIFIPLIFSPIIGAVILNTINDYTVLFGVAAACFLIAAVTILPIKQVS